MLEMVEFGWKKLEGLVNSQTPSAAPGRGRLKKPRRPKPLGAEKGAKLPSQND